MTDSVESVLQKLVGALVAKQDQVKIVHSTEFDAIVRSALEPMLAERNRNDGECHICKTKTQGLACSPGKWPMWLEYYGGNGKTRPYHRGCVIKALHDHEAAEQALREAQADATKFGALWDKEIEMRIAAEADSEKLRELLRHKDDAMAVALDRLGGHGGVVAAIAEALSHSGPYTKQALSPPPTPAPDTNTQSLCRAKPSPDSLELEIARHTVRSVDTIYDGPGKGEQG